MAVRVQVPLAARFLNIIYYEKKPNSYIIRLLFVCDFNVMF